MRAAICFPAVLVIVVSSVSAKLPNHYFSRHIAPKHAPMKPHGFKPHAPFFGPHPPFLAHKPSGKMMPMERMKGLIPHNPFMKKGPKGPPIMPMLPPKGKYKHMHGEKFSGSSGKVNGIVGNVVRITIVDPPSSPSTTPFENSPSPTPLENSLSQMQNMIDDLQSRVNQLTSPSPLPSAPFMPNSPQMRPPVGPSVRSRVSPPREVQSLPSPPLSPILPDDLRPSTSLSSLLSPSSIPAIPLGLSPSALSPSTPTPALSSMIPDDLSPSGTLSSLLSPPISPAISSGLRPSTVSPSLLAPALTSTIPQSHLSTLVSLLQRQVQQQQQLERQSVLRDILVRSRNALTGPLDTSLQLSQPILLSTQAPSVSNGQMVLQEILRQQLARSNQMARLTGNRLISQGIGDMQKSVLLKNQAAESGDPDQQQRQRRSCWS